jgi:hypothetical protein
MPSSSRLRQRSRRLSRDGLGGARGRRALAPRLPCGHRTHVPPGVPRLVRAPPAARRPPPLGAHVELLSSSDLPFLSTSYSPVLRQIEDGNREGAYGILRRGSRPKEGAAGAPPAPPPGDAGVR